MTLRYVPKDITEDMLFDFNPRSTQSNHGSVGDPTNCN